MGDKVCYVGKCEDEEGEHVERRSGETRDGLLLGHANHRFDPVGCRFPKGVTCRQRWGCCEDF